MATQIEKILNRDINSVKELRQAIRDLQDSIANVSPETEEFAEASRQLEAAQAQLTAVTRANTQENNAAADSIIGMEREYKKMYNTYKSLSEEQRKSPMGKAMADDLADMSKKLNETKMDVGNFKDNIGHYSEGVMDAFQSMSRSIRDLNDPLKLVGGGVQELGKSFKVLISNPLAATVLAAVAAFKLFQNAVKQSKEAQVALNDAAREFKPIMDGINAVLVEVVKCFADVTKWTGQFITGLFGVKKAANEAAQALKQVNDQEGSLSKFEAQEKRYNANRERTIRDLKEQAKNTTDVKKQTELLNEAKRQQDLIDQSLITQAKNRVNVADSQVKLQQIEYDNAKAMAEEYGNDESVVEDLKKAEEELNKALAVQANALAALDTAVDNHKQNEKNWADSVKDLMGKSGSSFRNYRQEAKDLFDELAEYYKSDETKLTEKYKKEFKLLEKYHFKTTLLTKKYNEDLKNIAEEAYKANREKVSAALSEVKAYRDWVIDISEGTDAEKMLQKMEHAQAEFEKMREKFNFDEWLTVDPSREDEIIKTIDEIIENIKNKTDIDLKFPPKENEEPFKTRLENFRENVETVADNIKSSIKDIKNTISKEDIETALNEKYFAIMSARADAIRNSQEMSMEQIAIENQQMIQMEADKWWQIMNNENLAYEERLQAAESFYAAQSELADMAAAEEQIKAQATQENWQNALETFNDVAGSINKVMNSYDALIKSELQDGKITDKEAKKKRQTMKNLEKVMLAVNLAQIAANTAVGIMGVWQAYGTELAGNTQTAMAAGPGFAAAKAALDAKSLASAILRTVAIGTAGAANMAAATMGTIAKLNAMNAEESGGGSAGVAAAPAEINSNPYTYTRTVQTQEEEDAIYNKNYFVSVTDINDVQNRVQVTQEESTF